MMACTFLDSGLNSAVTFVSFDFQELISFRSNYPAYLIFSVYESKVTIGTRAFKSVLPQAFATAICWLTLLLNFKSYKFQPFVHCNVRF